VVAIAVATLLDLRRQMLDAWEPMPPADTPATASSRSRTSLRRWVVIHARLPLVQQPPRLHVQGLRHAVQHLERALLAARLELGHLEAAGPDALGQGLLRRVPLGASPLDVPSYALQDAHVDPLGQLVKARPRSGAAAAVGADSDYSLHLAQRKPHRMLFPGVSVADRDDQRGCR
jgi:hypothetical protein